MGLQIKRGDIYYVDLDPVIGSEQGGERPVLIVSNNTGNLHSPTVIIAPITGRVKKASLPTHCHLPAAGGLDASSVVLLEQIRTIDKSRLQHHIGRLDSSTMESVGYAISVSLGMEL